MDPTTVAKLKALNLVFINDGLQLVARTWARHFIDHLPIADSLESLQARYAELLQCLPPCTPQELEPILTQYARALGLKGDTVTVSQEKFFLAQIGARYQSPTKLVRHAIMQGSTRQYPSEIYDAPDSIVSSFSLTAGIYIESHRQLGTHWPTFSDEMQQYLCDHNIQQEFVIDGYLTLSRTITIHSRWISFFLNRSGSDTE